MWIACKERFMQGLSMNVIVAIYNNASLAWIGRYQERSQLPTPEKPEETTDFDILDIPGTRELHWDQSAQRGP